MGCTGGEISNVESYFMGDLKKQIGLHQGRELPGFMNFTVFKHETASYINDWKPGSESLRLSVANAIEAAGLHFFDVHTQGQSNADMIKDRLSSAFENFIVKASADATAKMEIVLYQETQIPLTVNHYLWDTINKLRDERLLEKLDILPTKGDDDDLLSAAAVVAALKSDVGNDSNESQEVNDMIDMLKSYCKLAMERYVDGMCAIVSRVYTSDACLDAMAEHLDKELVSGLDDVKVQGLFEEPSALLAKRRRMKEIVERLSLASQRLAKRLRL